jgi:hypothetical protein
VSSLRRSRSLLVLNVSGNPGITDSLRNFIFERIRCKKASEDQQRTIDINLMLDSLESADNQAVSKLVQSLRFN